MIAAASTRGSTSTPHRLGAQCLERIELLGHLHRSQFSRDAGADATGHHDAREHGPELAQHRRRDEAAHEECGPERRQLHGRLEGEHHAGEQPRQQHDRNRLDPDGIHLRQQSRAGPASARPGSRGSPGQEQHFLQREDCGLERSAHDVG